MIVIKKFFVILYLLVLCGLLREQFELWQQNDDEEDDDEV